MLGLSIGLEHPDDGWWCTTWTTPPVTAHTRSQMREGRIVAPGGPSESSPLTWWRTSSDCPAPSSRPG